MEELTTAERRIVETIIEILRLTDGVTFETNEELR